MHTSQQTPTKTKIPPNFVNKLFNILNDPANKNIIRWVQSGKGFQIVHENIFIQNVLAKYYRHSNIASFVRQLNMYGFRKVKEDDKQYYIHPLFCKDNPQNIYQISRKPEKKLLFAAQIQKRKQNQACETTVTSKKKMRKVFFAPTVQSASKQTANNDKSSISSLANLIGRSEATIFNHRDLNQELSICEGLEDPWKDKANGKQNTQKCSIKSKVIYWTPSEIMSKQDA